MEARKTIVRLLILVSISAISVRCEIPNDQKFGKDENIYEKPTFFDQADTLKGNIFDTVLFSRLLNEPRKFSVYTPANYNKTTSYGLLLVTDDIGTSLPYFIENLIDSGIIDPIIVVGIYNREVQPVDSIFREDIYDFRSMEMLKGETIYAMTIKQKKEIRNGDMVQLNRKEVSDFKHDTAFYNIVSNRYFRFCNWINLEVLPFVELRWAIDPDPAKRSIGGFSNGGAFVYSYSCDFQDNFGNAIVMSPAGPEDKYNFSNSKYTYYITAGTEEPFYAESVNYLDVFDSLDLKYYHRTYNAGHDPGMWMDFYLASIKMIYGRDK